MRNGEEGLTLIELLVAVAISFIVFLGLTGGVLLSLDHNVRNALRDEAVLVGENRMNEIRSLPFDNVASGNPAVQATTEARQVRGFTVTYTVTPAVADVETELRQVNVTVAWTRNGHPYSHAVSTIVRRL